MAVSSDCYEDAFTFDFKYVWWLHFPFPQTVFHAIYFFVVNSKMWWDGEWKMLSLVSGLEQRIEGKKYVYKIWEYKIFICFSCVCSQVNWCINLWRYVCQYWLRFVFVWFSWGDSQCEVHSFLFLLHSITNSFMFVFGVKRLPVQWITICLKSKWCLPHLKFITNIVVVVLYFKNTYVRKCEALSILKSWK